MNWIKGSALQENTIKKNHPQGGGKVGHLSLIQIGKHLRAPGILSHVSELRNTLAPSVRYYDPVRNFSPRLFRNHTIAQSQQLARLCVSEPSRWMSAALPGRGGWQCLHGGSSATAADLILTFPSSSSFSPLPLTACRSSSRQPQQQSFPSRFFRQGFPWLHAATSCKLRQNLAAAQAQLWLFLGYSLEMQEAQQLSLEQLVLFTSWSFFYEGTSSEDRFGETRALIPCNLIVQVHLLNFV